MTLSFTDGIADGQSLFTLNRALQAHLAQSLEQINDDLDRPLLVNPVVDIILGDQVYLVDPDVGGNLHPLQIDFDAEYVFKSESTEFDAKVFVSEAFNSPEERESFRNRLTQSNDPFYRDVVNIAVLVEGEIPIEEEPDNDSDGSSLNIGIIAGAAGGGAILIALAGILLLRNRNGKPDGIPTEVQSSFPSRDGTLTAEILVNKQDDVSTLGDPVFETMNFNTTAADRDEQTASIGNDFDYLKSLGKVNDKLGVLNNSDKVSSSASGMTKLGLGQVNASVFSDDTSFDHLYGESQMDEKYEVDVPPGKLGMVIDTPSGGVPVVHAIKADSILADQVKVGDRLISVDGEDVTTLTAVQVSRLISSKSQQERLLVFLRNSKRRGSK